MSVLEFIQIILQNKKWVIYFPLIVGLGVFAFTQNSPHQYTSDMVIYTGIASGFNPDNDYDSKIDFHAVSSRFDNLINIIKSGETRKELSLKLIAFFIKNPESLKTLLKNAKDDHLAGILTPEFVKKYSKEDEETTAEYLDVQLAKDPESGLHDLVFGEKSNPFNVKSFEEIKAERLDMSDMLHIEYTCVDPMTCKKTLDFTKDIFLKKYKSMLIGEANSAVKYFKEQTAISKQRLEVAEEKLKGFRSQNGVINYYEQTKYIADQKEGIDKGKSALEMEISGYKTALASVQAKIDSRYLIQLESEKVVLLKKHLATDLNKAGIDAIKGNKPQVQSGESEGLQQSLNESVNRLYALNNSREGVPSKTLLQEWLQLTIDKEEAESKLEVLKGNKADFEKVFDRYAPMGSELSKLEREVETLEKEYLNLLHNLNQAILRENNLEVSENISVIDDANLPFLPNPAKRIILMIAAILGSLILAVVTLIIRQYLDSSLASPLRMEKLIGLKTATAFMAESLYPEAKAAMEQKSYTRWQMAMAKILQNETEKKTILIVPFNVGLDQVKPYTSGMCSWLHENGFNISLKESEKENDQTTKPKIILSDKMYAEQYPRPTIEDLAMVILFFDATSKLDEYQTQSVEEWKKTGVEIKGALVNTAEQQISKYLGDIPKHKSKFRIFMKKQFLRYAS